MQTRNRNKESLNSLFQCCRPLLGRIFLIFYFILIRFVFSWNWSKQQRLSCFIKIPVSIKHSMIDSRLTTFVRCFVSLNLKYCLQTTHRWCDGSAFGMFIRISSTFFRSRCFSKKSLLILINLFNWWFFFI